MKQGVRGLRHLFTVYSSCLLSCVSHHSPSIEDSPPQGVPHRHRGPFPPSRGIPQPLGGLPSLITPLGMLTAGFHSHSRPTRSVRLLPNRLGAPWTNFRTMDHGEPSNDSPPKQPIPNEPFLELAPVGTSPGHPERMEVRGHIVVRRPQLLRREAEHPAVDVLARVLITETLGAVPTWGHKPKRRTWAKPSAILPV